MRKELNRKMKRKGGFTLIELITVIIILGVLAAVVTPKYFDMSTKAKEAAVKGAVAEAVSRVNMAYASYTLNNSAAPADLAAISGSSYLDLNSGVAEMGGWNATITQAGTTITINVTDGTNTGTGTMEWP